ncbi:Metallo-dependent phosphatase [Wolfiporia cocos MD-104 SS10]|uniref:Sphingomyelin phosphodiesterase n=1 Tax=Wolfiporia cocos (strain MD-104) TaxID=742152 RepID=A0A2H3JJD5_WOLCO|nr:Metallo-dependent phosphatase [Wolfiporia cocos MD-104 SS10]
MLMTAMFLQSILTLLSIANLVLTESSAGNGLGPTAYTISGTFPTSIYESYYNDPTATTAQPQPVITDPVTHEVYPYWLTDPETIPGNDTWEPHLLPPVASPSQLLETAYAQILSIVANPVFGNDTCTRCQAALEIAKFLALTAPQQVPALAVRLCEHFEASSDCGSQYGEYTLGPTVAQVAAYADTGGYDGQMICSVFASLCPLAPTSPLNLTGWFAKPKPDPLPPPRQATGQRLKVLHLSDFHIDPRYAISAEANCSTSLCCRYNNYGEGGPDHIAFPAPRYGAFLCDTPYPLAVGALQAIPVLAGTEDTGFNFTLYTGDLVSHDPFNELSAEYTLYTETMVFDLIKRLVKTGPVYAVQGNHDTYMTAQNAPYNLGGEMGEQFNWNYDHLAALWELEDWISPETAQQARTHYAAYTVQRQDGLRIISINTDFWYTQNAYNYINLASSDNSGMMRFLTDELQDAEDAGDRVWIIGHVPSGYSKTDPLQNPTNLFYQIVDRFSPHVIAGIFWGHTHEDQLNIFYANNATVMNTNTAQAVAWIGPSVTPLTNYNSGFRVYEVDSGTFEVLDSYTWFADVNSFPELDGQTEFGPTYEFEYSARTTYGPNVPGWGPDDPLNATWWHLVTEAMESDSSLVETFYSYASKGSIRIAPCTGECIPATICSIRSASASLLFQNCL